MRTVSTPAWMPSTIARTGRAWSVERRSAHSGRSSVMPCWCTCAGSRSMRRGWYRCAGPGACRGGPVEQPGRRCGGRSSRRTAPRRSSVAVLRDVSVSNAVLAARCPAPDSCVICAWFCLGLPTRTHSLLFDRNGLRSSVGTRRRHVGSPHACVSCWVAGTVQARGDARRRPLHVPEDACRDRSWLDPRRACNYG